MHNHDNHDANDDKCKNHIDDDDDNDDDDDALILGSA